MKNRNRKMIGILAATAAMAAGPGAASALADFSVSDATTTEGGDLAFTVTATCQNAIFPCIDERFTYSVSGDSAQEGADFPSVSSAFLLSTLTPKGTVSRTITIPTNDDDIDEPSEERLTFHLSHHANMGNADRIATGTIRDNDDEPQVNSVTAPSTVNEGTGGSRSVPFTVKLSAPSEQTLTRSYSTADGTAKAGEDYLATTGNLTFSPGQTQKTVDVPIVTDSTDEPDETFHFNSGSAGALVTILDDDLAPVVIPDPKPNPTPNPNTGGGGQVTPAPAAQPAAPVVIAPSSTKAPAPAKKKAVTKAKKKSCRKGYKLVKKGKGKRAKLTCKKVKAKKRS